MSFFMGREVQRRTMTAESFSSMSGGTATFFEFMLRWTEHGQGQEKRSGRQRAPRILPVLQTEPGNNLRRDQSEI